MRALDRLALYSTCLASAVIVAGTALVVQHLRPDQPVLGQQRRPEQPVVQPVDLSSLTPQLRQALEAARTDGLHHARAELETLHAEMMRRVDDSLLDWYFGYFTQQRLGLVYAYTTGTNWIAGLFLDVDPEAAEKNLQQAVAKEFELRVMPGPLLEQHLQRIARQSVSVFVGSLQQHLQAIPKRYAIPPSQWDEYLDRITFVIKETEGSRSVPASLKALSAGVVLSGASVTAALAPYVTAQLGRQMAFAGATRVSGPLFRSAAGNAGRILARQAAARGLAAGAGTWGGALTGGLTVAALIGWEMWDHQATVAENRPLLRSNIDQFLRLYEAGLVEPGGMIGSTLHDIERQIAAGLPA